MGWESKMEKARRLHRPSLKDWAQDRMAEKFPAFQREILNRPSSYEWLLLPGVPHPKGLPAVLDAYELEYEHFTQIFEAKGIPCVIKNVPEAEGWPATQFWTLEALVRDPDLSERYFKCGEDDDGKSIKVKLRHFIQYTLNNKDDSPLYVFDSSFDDDRVAKRILSDYKVPSFFRDDLFRLVSEARRPPYRWWLVGPERSGTTVHIDPLATSAWNTLLFGKKRWVLFPPHVPKHIAKGKQFVFKGEDDEAIHYFMNILPRIKKRATQVGNHGDFKDFACYEFTQHAGETVYIPNGWWHTVLNLTHTVGVTQNFCSPRNFNQVWRKTRTGRKRMASKWLNQLDIHYPELASRAKKMNERDSFVMKYDPEEMKMKDAEKQRRKEQEEQQRHARMKYRPARLNSNSHITASMERDRGSITSINSSLMDSSSSSMNFDRSAILIGSSTSINYDYDRNSSQP
mmetsp:Transcript_40128/g.56523  ORF Transcript_40128/g.56523 Transcript_40128/m.56523 type:complete len:457 (+) Transcript_40128:131-1501(+)|eukprot:CAMPEP_0202456474 /NCGR_PEP_ID=MMETSP1360-20130828/13716_1 /ASSEMBLY_ACC=CAM_ASM_000848 /TAXON_ID=515479 /ORGANISM="Licmophora paradoxa, Strain CCMP2313" /LENGTH=456 /DNA_ID=CAMNT_0049076279 /DNA_START=60 /DNA_END=1430 /DNA_ORIENTATION=+